MKFKLLLFCALNLTAFAGPLQDAINAADPGDILRLNDGLYERRPQIKRDKSNGKKR